MAESWVIGIIIGIILMIAGVIILSHKELSSINSIGAIVLVGGALIIGLTAFSKIRKPAPEKK